MAEKVIKYTRDNITVLWKPDLCIHSKKCWHELAEVFNPRNRPWVNMQGAATDRIMEQVSKCPSGALSYIQTTTDITPTEHATTTTAVEVLQNGPLMVYGNLTMKDKNGTETTKNKVTAFCRCGASANKPFCDGSHIRVGFKDE
jgi:uncharacterized Fe-S cluster protein YjdI